MAWMILAGWNPFAGLADAIDGTLATATDPGTASVLLFTFAIGALIGQDWAGRGWESQLHDAPLVTANRICGA